MKKIQEKIKALRTHKGLTQKQMADLLHLSTNGYANIEKGDTELTLSRIEQIANLFEVDFLDLLDTKEKNSSFYFNGNNNTNYQIQSDQALIQENEKLKIELSAQKEKVKLLEDKIVLLEEKIQFIKEKNATSVDIDNDIFLGSSHTKHRRL